MRIIRHCYSRSVFCLLIFFPEMKLLFDYEKNVSLLLARFGNIRCQKWWKAHILSAHLLNRMMHKSKAHWALVVLPSLKTWLGHCWLGNNIIRFKCDTNKIHNHDHLALLLQMHALVRIINTTIIITFSVGVAIFTFDPSLQMRLQGSVRIRFMLN